MLEPSAPVSDAAGNPLTALLQKHRDLDYTCRHPGDRVFVSDWYCEHPFIERYLAPAMRTRLTRRQMVDYYFQNDTADLHRPISAFHERHDDVAYSPDEIFVGAGTSALLTAQMLMLWRAGIRKLFYVRPLYYTFYYIAELLGLELHPVNQAPLHEPGEVLALPKTDGWLIVCDPIWFMGKPIHPKHIETIRRWQGATGGCVLVDGAFQYMNWREGRHAESTAHLLQDQTLRTVCPTKSVTAHGVRFSYVLAPSVMQEDLRYAYANSAGAGCVFDHEAGRQIMTVLNSRASNGALLRHIQAQYARCLEADVFRDPLGAEATYFAFVQPTGDLGKMIVMDQDFFDTTGFDGFVRFNLLLRNLDRVLELVRPTR